MITCERVTGYKELIRGARYTMIVVEDLSKVNQSTIEDLIESDVIPSVADYNGTVIVTAQLPITIPKTSVLKWFDMFCFNTKFNTGE